MPAPPLPQSRPFLFIAVGGVASAIHWLVAVALVERLAFHPLAANGVGWLTAFGVSFAGHHCLTFRGHSVPVHHAAGRFFLLSALGFAINEATYALALKLSDLGYAVLLGIVLILVAALTWLVSRFWVFRDIGNEEKP
ncbi:GtrA family protein [Thermomonas hydrothermalis]|uniref:Putative flippase GtrA (Transmembrane translocase of bactoprenol-linked glucose) n=1 Tax=Thermomonas hydrothermalis TaxID=213588 RepID=A0A1M4SF01_9GAMM|nr:GtrA family protein [Thermomonas hydrothermalis]SHE30761.1 Putative flippase GtrA (transmembrane translocase of bactoprenol-linked glucose) [Thermomonas hydrothermalis]